MKNILYILAVSLLAVSCMGLNEADPGNLSVPEVKNFNVNDNKGSLVFTLSASVDKTSLGLIEECGFYYAEDREFSDPKRIVCKVTGTSFSADVTLQGYDRNYYACAFVTNGTDANEVCSDIKKISIKSLEDYIELDDPTMLEYSSNSAKVKVVYEAADGVEVSEYGICYSESSILQPDCNVVKAEGGVAVMTGLETGVTYHMCAYVKDGDYVIYGETLPLAVYGMPVVHTVKDVESGSSYAILSGYVEDDCGKDVKECGFIWAVGATERLDVDRNQIVKVASDVGEFSAKIEGLEPNRTYSFCAYALNEEGVSYGEVVRFTTGVDVPAHGQPLVSDITSSSALLTADVLSDGGERSSEYGFFWGLDHRNLDRKVVCDGESFVYELTGLDRNTRYYVRSYSTNSRGTANSQVVEFATLAELPVVSLDTVYDVLGCSAMCSISVIDEGGDTVIDKGVVYAADPDADMKNWNSLSAGRGSESCTCCLTDLEPNRTYFVAAYARNSAGIAYGNEKSFKTLVVLPELNAVEANDITVHSFTLNSDVLSDGGETPVEVGFYYSENVDVEPTSSIKVPTYLSGNSFSVSINGLNRASRFYARAYAVNSAGENLSDVISVSTLPELPVVETREVFDVEDVTASCGGVVIDDGGAEITAKGIIWGTEPELSVKLATKTDEGTGLGEFTGRASGLAFSTKYYVCAYAANSAGTSYGQVREFTTKDLDLSSEGTANCYIVSSSGSYRFLPVKGNSLEPVGTIGSVAVLWETYGNSTLPKVGALVYDATYEEGYICFKVPEKYHTGNALIAAKDARGEILWSWHIWLTDMPDECVYANDAGILMDRNLGATSATAGDVGTWGLLYQWGRKDPFLSTEGKSSDMAQSTGKWTFTHTTGDKGTIEYTIKHPTEFLSSNSTYNNDSGDWQWGPPDKSRWSPDKTLYDPCPRGWRVPDSGIESPWCVAGFQFQDFNSAYVGMTFGTEMSSPATWYPVAARIDSDGRYWWYGKYTGTTPIAYYWTNIIKEVFMFSEYDLNMSYRLACEGHPVRCMKDM